MSSLETEKGTEAAPLPPPPVACSKYCTVTEVALRVLLLAASIVAVVVMVTSKETEMVPVSPGPRPVLAPVPAKFNHSPAFIYFVAALSVAGLYSIITTIASLAVVWKPDVPAKRFLILLAHDVLILGIVASATGTAGGVGYIGLKGNSHVQWNKICSVYSTFCRHVGASIAVALFASVVLVVLVILNAVALFRRTPGGATSSLFW